MAPVVRLGEVTYHGMQDLCRRLREIDAIEIYNMRPHDSWLQLAFEAHALIRNNGRGVLAYYNGRPAAVCAYTQSWTGVWEIMMFGTDDLPKVAVPLMQWARRQTRDLVENHGGMRLQCDSRVGHEEAHKMLRALGAVEEGPPMECYGKDGSSYQRFVWIWGRNSQVAEGAA